MKIVVSEIVSLHLEKGLTMGAMAQCWQDFADVMSAGVDRVILFGVPGTGKTFAGLTYGLTEGQSAHRLVCNEEMTSADVTGMFLPNSDGGFSWLDGMATKAWRDGGRLVIDECDKPSGDVSSLLLSFTDTVASASYDLPTGERVKPKEGYSVVMTTNLEHPDELPIALRDRFPVALEINAPHPNALLTLPEDLRKVAEAVISAEPERRASIRAFYAYAQLRETLGAERSARIVFGETRGEAIIDALRVGSLA
jgi:MoxR-like ATPase